MDLMKYVLILAVLLYGAYWVSAHGIYRWYDRQIEQSVQKYYEVKEFYPMNLNRLTEEKYESEAGQSKYFMNELPQARQGYKWTYDPDREDKVQMKEKEEKSSNF